MKRQTERALLRKNRTLGLLRPLPAQMNTDGHGFLKEKTGGFLNEFHELASRIFGVGRCQSTMKKMGVLEKGNFPCGAFAAKLHGCTTLSESPAFGRDAGGSYRLKFAFHLRLWGLYGF
jgi:hypothetical protein